MVTLIIGGISIFTTTIVVTLGPLMSNQITPILSGRKVRWKPVNRVILAGSDSFATSLALELAVHNIDFIQIVAPDEAPPLSGQPNIRGRLSNELLKQAGILHANAAILTGQDDAATLSAVLMIKRLNPNVRVAVVTSSSKVTSHLRSAEADLVFELEAVGARLLTNLIDGYAVPKELRDLI